MNIPLKICRICDKELPKHSYFYENPKMGDGFRNECINCTKKLRRESYTKCQTNSEANRRSRYGITPEEYQALLEKQNNLCAICKQPETMKNRTLAVDHCHNTNLVRGLLCARCNSGIGMFLNDIELLKEAVKYLKNLG